MMPPLFYCVLFIFVIQQHIFCETGKYANAKVNCIMKAKKLIRYLTVHGTPTSVSQSTPTTFIYTI